MDESMIISHRTLRRVSLAVLLIDELTGRAIMGSNARAWIEKEKPPIKKGDGWFVFTDLLPGKYTVLAEGGQYQRLAVECTAESDDLQTLRLRLKPAKTYPLTYGCLLIEGRAEPGAEITVYIPDKKNTVKLLGDADRGSEMLTVFHAGDVNLEGGTYHILSSDGTGENVFFGAKTDENTYRLNAPLAYDYQRIGTILVPASVTSADKNGSFFTVIGRGSSKAKIVFEVRGDKSVHKEYEGVDGNCFAPDLRE